MSVGCVLVWLCGMKKMPFWKKDCLVWLDLKVRISTAIQFNNIFWPRHWVHFWIFCLDNFFNSERLRATDMTKRRPLKKWTTFKLDWNRKKNQHLLIKEDIFLPSTLHFTVVLVIWRNSKWLKAEKWEANSPQTFSFFLIEAGQQQGANPKTSLLISKLKREEVWVWPLQWCGFRSVCCYLPCYIFLSVKKEV